jgi:hypothetical protein
MRFLPQLSWIRELAELEARKLEQLEERFVQSGILEVPENGDYVRVTLGLTRTDADDASRLDSV